MDHLDCVRVFIEVARLGSFSRASNKLDISPSRVTRSVSVLEQQLGTRLLNRTTRSLSLTESGAIYFERIQGILECLDETEQEVASRARSPSGILKILAPAAFGQHRLTPALSGYREMYPDVIPEVTLTDHNFGLIEDGHDIGIVPQANVTGVSFVSRPLTHTPFVVCASTDFIKRHGAPQHPSHLEKYPSLTTSVDASGTDERVFRGPGGNHQVSLSPALVAKDTEVLRQATLAGMGIGFLPVPLVAEDLRSGRLHPLLSEYKLPDFVLQIVYPSKQFLPAKVRTFIDYLIEYFRNDRDAAMDSTLATRLDPPQSHGHSSSPVELA
ncbi:LysR family transcriptional regulator [Paraburkholderia caribensis]|uniref:LysR family transcriptional regulator n=1 Tax=Paraburkholderia caribensis TaxID=75105 RepID=UPI001CB66988|nr:LysR family transcriptional regulator [Paraburkholderia caribensis]CAG9243724.1 LysR family transcriptional regulator [Paraburkholderia caribensis]